MRARYRLRVSRPSEDDLRSKSYRTYLVCYDDSTVSYFTGDQTPLALSNLIHNDAAEISFNLEDAADGKAAAEILKLVLYRQFRNNPKLCPSVEVLS